MPRLQRRSFAEPEETRRFNHGALRTVSLDEVVFGEYRLAGSGIAVESAGLHELKGLKGTREVFRVV